MSVIRWLKWLMLYCTSDPIEGSANASSSDQYHIFFLLFFFFLFSWRLMVRKQASPGPPGEVAFNSSTLKSAVGSCYPVTLLPGNLDRAIPSLGLVAMRPPEMWKTRRLKGIELWPPLGRPFHFTPSLTQPTLPKSRLGVNQG